MPIAANIYYHSPKSVNNDALPVILIHGAGGTHLNWPPEIRRLPGKRVFSIDLPGHGKSALRGFQTIEAYAESILNWMDAIGLYRACFVGHSMGGAIALMLAQQHKDRVIAISLISTGARLRVNPEILELTSTAQTFPTAIKMITSSAFSLQADSRLVELASKRMKQVRPSVLYGDFIACNGFDLLTSIPNLRVPALVICGEIDELTPLRYSQYLNDHLPDSTLHIIADGGHMVILEQPTKVAEILDQFLIGIPFSTVGFKQQSNDFPVHGNQ